MLLDLHHYASDVPPGGVIADLILDQHRITQYQLGQDTAVHVQLLHVADGPLGQRLLPVLPEHDPLRLGLVSGLRRGQEVPQISTKDNLCWTLACVTVWGIPVCHKSLEKLVIGQTAVIGGVLPDQPLYTFYPQLSPLVALGEGYRGEPVLDPVVLQELLGLLGHVGQAAVCGELLGDTVSRKELPESVLKLPTAACAGATKLNSWPAAEPVHDDEIVVAAQLEVVGGQLLEGIVWILQGLWWCTGL